MNKEQENYKDVLKNVDFLESTPSPPHKTPKPAVNKNRNFSCLTDISLLLLLGATILVGMAQVLRPFLSNMANSMFGMGLK